MRCGPTTRSGGSTRVPRAECSSEAAIRQLTGLAEWEPDFEKRRDHIFRDMLFGCAVTEITGHVSRRSVYYSKDASTDRSVVPFKSPAGNLPSVPADHDFKQRRNGTLGPCKVCKAPPTIELAGRENYAYAFIHGTYPTEEMSNMKFDVIVGNPSYHLEDAGHGASATPVFHRFVEQAIRMTPVTWS